MSETTKLKFTSPIEKYLDQIGHWFVIRTTRMIAVRRERKGAKAAQADAASARCSCSHRQTASHMR